MDKFNDLCRTCNSSRTNLINLFSSPTASYTENLHEVLSSVCPDLSIQKDDQLPQQICFFCSKQMEIAYNFQQQCKQSYDELWKVVEDELKEKSVTESIIKSESQPDEDEESCVGGQTDRHIELQEETHRTWEDFEDEDEKTEIEQTERSIETKEETLRPYEDFEDDDEKTDIGSPEFLEDTNNEDIVMAPEKPLPIDQSSSHSQTHAEAGFECSCCEKHFLTSGGLFLHKKLAHKITKQKHFPCKYCNQIFDSENDQKRHMRLQHKSDSKSKLSCHICQKVFLGKNRLDQHLMYHENNQFKCLVGDCKRTFGIKYKLTDHLKRFHGIALSSNQMKSL